MRKNFIAIGIAGAGKCEIFIHHLDREFWETHFKDKRSFPIRLINFH